MQVADPVTTEPSAAERRSLDWRLVLAGVLALGIFVAVVGAVVWWRRGGPRRAVKELAEHGAVALADVIVDEVFPAA
jgi:hypothetical protein